MYQLTEVERRVLRGGLWLTLVAPGWPDYIDWEALDIASVRHCVAGQVFTGCPGPCWSGYEHLSVCLGVGVEERAELGFTRTPSSSMVTRVALERAWCELWQPA